jgi:hypothetical protein
MHRRTGAANAEARPVLEGLQGAPGAERRPAHRRRQAPDDRWRDHLLARAPQAVEGHEQSPRDARRAREAARLDTRVGALTLERKKSDEALGGTAGRHPSWPNATTPWCDGFGSCRRRPRSGALWAYLHFVAQSPVKQPRLLRLMRAHHLLAPPHLRLKAHRTPAGRPPRLPNRTGGGASA